MDKCNFKSIIRTNKHPIVYSILTSLFLVIAGYYTNNMSLFTGENLNAYSRMELLKEFLKVNNNENDDDDVIFINTAFDKELIPFGIVYEDGGNVDTLGNTEITSRKDLYHLLKILEKVDYKYLILDIDLNKRYKSNDYILDKRTGDKIMIDDLLVNTINNMKRVVIARPRNGELLDKSLEDKAAFAYYLSTVTSTNFVRYKYYDKYPFVPLMVYNEIQKEHDNDTIRCHYPFGIEALKPLSVYTQGHNLCYNSVFLDFNYSNDYFSGQLNGDTGIFDYVKILGRDIIDEGSSEDIDGITECYRGKYIIIGNFETDSHDTYAGSQYGPVILYKAIKALDNNKHIVKPFTVVLLLLLYFIISLFILLRKSVFDLLPITKNIKNGVLLYIIDIFTFSSILYIYHFIEYMANGVSFSFIVPIIIFTAQKTYITIKNNYNMKHSFLLIIFSLLAGLFLSFKAEDQQFIVTYASSNSIRIDNEIAHKNQVFSLRSTIKFPSTSSFIRAKALKKISVRDKNNQERIWYAHTLKEIRAINNTVSFSINEWLRCYRQDEVQ